MIITSSVWQDEDEHRSKRHVPSRKIPADDWRPDDDAADVDEDFSVEDDGTGPSYDDYSYD